MPYPRGAKGRARVNARYPQAFAICDRCGIRYNHADLVWQYEWAGTGLQNQRILVCQRTCLDEPNEQLRVYVLPADPIPIRNPRPETADMQAGLIGLGNRYGNLYLTQPLGSGYPVAPTFVAPGGVWWDAANQLIRVVPGGTATPGVPPMVFGKATYLDLLNLGGANLPLVRPQVAGTLWVNGDTIQVSRGADNSFVLDGSQFDGMDVI